MEAVSARQSRCCTGSSSNSLDGVLLRRGARAYGRATSTLGLATSTKTRPNPARSSAAPAEGAPGTAPAVDVLARGVLPEVGSPSPFASRVNLCVRGTRRIGITSQAGLTSVPCNELPVAVMPVIVTEPKSVSGFCEQAKGTQVGGASTIDWAEDVSGAQLIVRANFQCLVRFTTSSRTARGRTSTEPMIVSPARTSRSIVWAGYGTTSNQS